MVEQGLQYDADVHLGENVADLERVEVDGEELWRLTTDQGGDYLTRTLIITAGHGAFEPRTLPIRGLEAWLGRGLHYFVKRKASLRGQPLRDRRRRRLGTRLDRQPAGHGGRGRSISSTAATASAGSSRPSPRSGGCRRVRDAHPDPVRGACAPRGRAHRGGRHRAHRHRRDRRVDCDALILQLGFISRLGAIADWGLEVVGKKQVRVDPTTFETALPNVFAAGDVAHYEGKITLITIGLGEAAIAANQCVARVRGVKVQPAYSTE